MPIFSDLSQGGLLCYGPLKNMFLDFHSSALGFLRYGRNHDLKTRPRALVWAAANDRLTNGEGVKTV